MSINENVFMVENEDEDTESGTLPSFSQDCLVTSLEDSSLVLRSSQSRLRHISAVNNYINFFSAFLVFTSFGQFLNILAR